ncbi:MAG: hypothetical protein ABEJ48_05060 [Halobacteriales archaeon]
MEITKARQYDGVIRNVRKHLDEYPNAVTQRVMPRGGGVVRVAIIR